ncbi:transposable element Tcb1 transposase [Trichonephila clavipes]|nr:transposable element Tcb1 transposase [Trichonephila clavipes]
MQLRRFRRQYQQLSQFERGKNIIYTKTRLRTPSRQTSRREDSHIVRNARVQPNASSAAIQAQPIWDHLGWRVGHPTSLNELEARLQQIWNEMSQDIIQNLYASMPDRIASYIHARGGSTGRNSILVLVRIVRAKEPWKQDVKITSGDWCPPIWHRIKKRYQLSGNVVGLQWKNSNRQSIRTTTTTKKKRVGHF